MTEGTRDVMLGYLRPSDAVSTSFHESLFELLNYDAGHDQRVVLRNPIQATGDGIPDARNMLAGAFLESEAEYLFMVDADMGFEPFILDQLLQVADPDTRPVVGGLAFAFRNGVPDGMSGWRNFPMPTLFDPIDHGNGNWKMTGRRHFPVNTLVRSGATGGAVLLIHRSVFERMGEKYGPIWFDRIRDFEGDLVGEDVSFCMRLYEMEIPLHVHTGIRTTHFKTLWVGEQDFWMSFTPGPATDRIDVIVPVLHRPQNIKPFMDTLTASTGLATAHFICEEDDDEEIAEVLACGGEVISSPLAHTFAEKVNLAYAVTDAPWLLLIGDDVRFRPGWLDHAMDVHRRYGAQVIGTNDLCNPRVFRGEHATHPIIARSYIDEVGASWDGPGVVCHEGYRHWYCDDEWTTVAKSRGTFQVALGSQIEHVHPLNGVTPMDAIYELGQSHAKEDGELFKQRLARFAA